MRLGRRSILGAPLLLAACSDDTPVRTSFPPLRYDYLTRLQLAVADIEYGQAPPPGPLENVNPTPPGPALLQMAQDRLAAGGGAGRAVFSINEAQVARIPNGLEGALAVRLEALSPDGGRLGFAEARVSRRAAGIGRDLRGALYDITRQMLDDMNVEFEFQVRRSLRDLLQDATTAPPPPPVQRQELGAPNL